MKIRSLLTGIGLLAASLPAAAYEDDAIHVMLPVGWSIDGGDGEYWLDSELDVASLLLLPDDPDRPLDVRLAEIEEQFLSTGRIELEESEPREEDGQTIHYRRYRLMLAGSTDPDAILLHQYLFERTGVRVLLQVETPPGRQAEDLFFRVFQTLEVRASVEPFEVME